MVAKAKQPTVMSAKPMAPIRPRPYRAAHDGALVYKNGNKMPTGSSDLERPFTAVSILLGRVDRGGAGRNPLVCPTFCTTVSGMAVRQKRSISLPPDLAEAIDTAAAAEGTTVSAWLAETAAHRLRLDAGRRGIAEWERDNGPLTTTELADGLARARAILGRNKSVRRRAS
jgi:hypothetical protein